MSKHEADLPERLQAAGATNLERRLLAAAGREQPSRELSERMAQAIGISMSAVGTTAEGGAKTGTTGANAASSSSALVPWVSGALVVVGVAVGALVTTRPGAKPPELPALVAPGTAVSSAPAPIVIPLADPPLASPEAPSSVDEDTPARTAAPPRGRRGTAAGELANQIALVDAARSALSAGSAAHALSIVREYQSEYPSGTFRPEVAAVKIEALVKMGRTAEARTLAERFVVAYGPSPLADRVARLAQIAEP